MCYQYINAVAENQSLFWDYKINGEDYVIIETLLWYLEGDM